MNKFGTLVFFCGKMGAGKSTKALEMTREIDAILISEDDWLAKLYPEEINNFNDYIKYSSRLKPLIKTLVQNILKSGVSVVYFGLYAIALLYVVHDGMLALHGTKKTLDSPNIRGFYER